MGNVWSDVDLVEKARGGDRDAFGELVRRHRAKAFDWARCVARDPHLAEDIVQEALFRAFLHVGTLADMERFLPWLHKIVRNEALMKMRKGEHSGKERTFTRLSSTAGDEERVNWSDVDSILQYLSGSANRGEEGDPSAKLAYKEFLVTLRQMLRCLTPRERAVFEAHFFRQLSPAEIARLFRTSTDSVYQSLTRARYKVKEERIRIRLRDYVKEQRESDVPERAALSPVKGPKSAEWKRCKTSFAGAVYAALSYVVPGRYSLTDVMGLTGQAFRLTVEEQTIDATGPSMYFWESKFREGLLNLGLESEHTGDGGAPPTPFMLNKGVRHIRRSILLGMPVIAWDLFSPEFGLICGYDDAEQLLHAVDARAKGMIPYDRFGRGLSGGLFVLSITGEAPIDEWEAVRNALQMAVRHAYGEMTFIGYATGLSAYDCWKAAFRNGSVDPLGSAYTAEIAADARICAAAFLRGLENKLCANGWEEAAAAAAEAAECYEAASDALDALSRMFPMPSGGKPREPEAAKAAIGLLGHARAAEEEGAAALERLIRSIGKLQKNRMEATF